MRITIFKNLFDTDVPFIISIEKVVKRIKEGSVKKTVEKIRLSTDQDAQNRYKKMLPAILFAGEFSERNKKGLKEHSGLMVTDFDDIPDSEMEAMFNKVKSNKHVVLLFRSPSGNGLKAVVRIPKCTAVEHERYFKKFEAEYSYDYFDTANCDVSRICFESYDPNLYYNSDAEVFSPIIEDKGYHYTEMDVMTPLEGEAAIVDRIMQWNWQKDFVEGQRNAFIYDVAGAFCEFGVSKEYAIEYINNNIVHGNFTETEVKNTVNSAYRGREFNSKRFVDYTKWNNLNKDVRVLSKDEILLEYGIQEEDYEKVRDKALQEVFWTTTKSKKGDISIKINPLYFKVFLENNGFKKTYINDAQKPTFVKVVENKVVETSPEKIKDFVLDYLAAAQEPHVWNYCANYHNLFSEQFLNMLAPIDLVMLNDTRTKSYIAFSNGILEVTKNSVLLKEYIDVNGYVWQNQIVNRNFVKGDITNEYQQFISNISNGNPNAMEHCIGYLLCTYKNKTNNKAVILNDEVISENPEGGTGKGLFVQGIQQIRNVSILDGKQFDDRKSFPYQTVSPETQILVFDDVEKNWNFEKKFSLVTEGITLERKNKDALKLSVEESPKIVISTNYAIRGSGNSHERRRHELEVSQYYGADREPIDDFGHQLFDDWDEKQFRAFDNYMVDCLQKYLSNGLIPQLTAKNIEKRKFISETAMEFHDWAEEAIKTNERLDKNYLYEAFKMEYEDFAKYLTQRTFTKWLRTYAKYKNIEAEEGVSNGQRWIFFNEYIDIEAMLQ